MVPNCATHHIWGKSIFKDKPYSCQWTSIFFDSFIDFWKWKQLFRIVETVFFDQSYFSASENHYWNYGKTVFKERAYSCKRTTDFMTNGNHLFFSIFQRLLPVIVYFCRQWKRTFRQNPSFRLVETDFRVNDGFQKQKKQL